MNGLDSGSEFCSASSEAASWLARDFHVFYFYLFLFVFICFLVFLSSLEPVKGDR